MGIVVGGERGHERASVQACPHFSIQKTPINQATCGSVMQCGNKPLFPTKSGSYLYQCHLGKKKKEGK